MNNVLGKINQAIGDSCLNSYLKDYKDMKALSVKDQHWVYFSDMKKAENVLKQLAKERVMKKTEEEMLMKDKTYRKPDEDNLLKKVYENEKGLMKTIGHSKDYLLTEIKIEEEL